jgi:hypothetical protein
MLVRPTGHGFNSLCKHINDLQVIPRQMEEPGSSANSSAIMRRISRGNEARDFLDFDSEVRWIKKRGIDH